MDDFISENATIINAEYSILGRLASNVAKRLLKGEEIIIINANKVMISGNPDNIGLKYFQRYKIKTKSNPLRGPFYPRETDQIFKRTVRGMLPYKKGQGKEAYKRLIVFKNSPEIFKEKKVEVLQNAKELSKKSAYITLEELNAKI
ncbi:50S ribosomal protein L13 [Candidatus Hodarchaeum mangrovi]